MQGKPFVPRQYQLGAIQTLVTNHGAGLLLDPGMGKTAAALMAFHILQEAGFAKTMLVVAPIKPMQDTWPKERYEWDDFRHLRIVTLHGDKKLSRLREPADIYIINPEGLQWLMANIDRFTLPDVLCVDESTKFKNSQAKRFKILRKILPHFKYRWILTGTFVPNGLLDIFGQAYIMDRGEALGVYVTHFQNAYGTYDQYKRKFIPADGAFEKVTDRIKDHVLRLDAEDWLDMPDLIKHTRLVKLPDYAMDMYTAVEKDFMAELHGKNIVAANSAAAGTKCRQIANGRVYKERETEEELKAPEQPVLPVHGAKTDELECLLEEIGENKVLIVYEYKHDKAAIMELLNSRYKKLGKDYQPITGLSGKRFSATTEAFNTGDLQYILAHAGSLHGINIQKACRYMIWYGITWNFEDYKQAVTRLYRQGQTSPSVMIYHIVAEGTLDEKVVEVLQAKDATQRAIEDMLKGE